MAPQKSPVTVKKPRGISAPKPAKPLNHNMPEFTNEFASIERELNRHKMGTFKVFDKDMTFKWTDGQNREIAPDSQVMALKESMENGVYRTDVNNRMSGIIVKDKLNGRIFHPSNFGRSPQQIKISEVAEFNSNAEYPIVMGGADSTPMEMQSGQHRMSILRQLKEKSTEQWWIVTIYDDGMFQVQIIKYNMNRTLEICKRGS